mmetsp:Transcript_49457/g.84586  ORF Transcript_49457/g.84586 Transcript_49457/m.84586 type:complete len:600 (+) Transcript_49457:640-2439(+)
MYEANEHTACIQVPRSLRNHEKVLRAWDQLRGRHHSDGNNNGPCQGGDGSDEFASFLARFVSAHELERRSRSNRSSRRGRERGDDDDDDKDGKGAEMALGRGEASSGHVLWVPRKKDDGDPGGGRGGGGKSSNPRNRNLPRFQFRPLPLPSTSSTPTSSYSSSSFSTLSSVRMAWGSAQEATSLLTVLNAVEAVMASTHDRTSNSTSPSSSSYLSPLEPAPASTPPSTPPSPPSSYRVCEAGLLMLELVDAPPEVTALKRLKCRNSDDNDDLNVKRKNSGDSRRASDKGNRSAHGNIMGSSVGGEGKSSANHSRVVNKMAQSSRLRVGASPDGLIKFSNGSVVVVEVKNHSPFREARSGGGGRGRGRGGRGSAKTTFEVNDLGPMTAIGAWHIPQLQLEMLCAGPTCRSALFASASATKGANLFLVQRDDAYIAEMMRLLVCFFERYVETGIEPPPSFFSHRPPPPPATPLQPQPSSMSRKSSPLPPPPPSPSSSPPPAPLQPTVTPCSASYPAFIARTALLAHAAALWCHVPEGDTQRRHGGEGPKGSSSTAGRSNRGGNSSSGGEGEMAEVGEGGGGGGGGSLMSRVTQPLDSGIFL